MEPDDLLCSRNARGLVCLVGWSFWSVWFSRMNFQSDQPDKPDRQDRPDEPAFAGRAQWKINQAPSLERKRASLEGSFYWGSFKSVLLACRGRIMKRQGLIRFLIRPCRYEIQRIISKKSLGLRSEPWQDISWVLSCIARQLAPYTERDNTKLGVTNATHQSVQPVRARAARQHSHPRMAVHECWCRRGAAMLFVQHRPVSVLRLPRTPHHWPSFELCS